MLDEVNLAITFTWEKLGAVTVDESGRLLFAKAPGDSGLYRFDIAGATSQCYIGETDTLNRRFQHYRTPGVKQETNLRVNALMREVLAAGSSIIVSIATKGFATSGGVERKLDLTLRSERMLMETAAIHLVRTAGVTLINL